MHGAPVVPLLLEPLRASCRQLLDETGRRSAARRGERSQCAAAGARRNRRISLPPSRRRGVAVNQPPRDLRTRLTRRRLLHGMGSLAIALTSPIWRPATAFGQDAGTAPK